MTLAINSLLQKRTIVAMQVTLMLACNTSFGARAQSTAHGFPPAIGILVSTSYKLELHFEPSIQLGPYTMEKRETEEALT